jgi:hypothetical protein
MDKTEFPELLVEFSMKADEMDLDEITIILGLKPTRTKKKDAHAVQPTGLAIKRDEWYLCTERKHAVYTDEALKCMIDILKEKEDVIKCLADTYNITIDFKIVVHAEEIFLPGFTLKNDSVRFLANLGATVDFEVHLY